MRGEYLLQEREILGGKKADDAIALGAWPVELHDPETKQIRWEFLKEEDDYYGIPLGCLFPRGVENLLVAGRCISATHVAQASTRVIAQAFAMGEAAGVVAAQSVKSKIAPREVSVQEVRKELRRRGALLEA